MPLRLMIPSTAPSFEAPGSPSGIFDFVGAARLGYLRSSSPAGGAHLMKVFSSETAGCASHPSTSREARSLTVSGKQQFLSFRRNRPL